MRQNTQSAASPSPAPSPPTPLAHVDVETPPAPSTVSSAGGGGPSGRRWEQSTARRRGEDISGVGDAAFGGSGRVGPASRTFWVSRLLRGIRFRALLKWIIAIVPTILLTARGGRSCSVHWKGGMKPHLIQMASDHALRPTGPYPVLYLFFFFIGS